MKTELQDRAWATLPEDFRKEVREMLGKISKNPACRSALSEGRLCTLEDLFGYDNLTAVEQPQPKFKVGDKVYKTSGHDRLDEYTVKKVYMDKRGGYVYDLKGLIGLIGIIGVEESNLCHTNQNPYTKLEPKGKESGEKGNNSENSLNLCEILRGHEGEKFFSPCYGNVTLSELRSDKIIITADVNGKKHTLRPDGTHISGSVMSCVNLLPSVGLYQQYPLDAAKAWSEWQKEQKKYALDVNLRTYDSSDFGELLHFRTSSDRDKCIEEIKSVIEKYSE